MNRDKKTLRVGAVQMVSKDGMIQENLERAVAFIDKAAAEGAKLILLPEFLPTGYIFTKAIWNAGEPKRGPTVQWLEKHAKRLGAYIGTSFLEAEGEDFYNTFVLMRPDGVEAGRVRKETPASFEAYFTKGERSSHTIQTDFGVVGVGICYECMLSYTPKNMYVGGVDLMLMPHSSPAIEPSFFVSKELAKYWDDMLKSQAEHYAKTLGVPTIMTNKSGPWVTPLPGLPMKQRSKFGGFTAIADSDGKLLKQLGDEEGAIVADVVLDPSRKTGAPPETFGRWSRQYKSAINFFRIVEAAGKIWYSLSSDRKKLARDISSH